MTDRSTDKARGRVLVAKVGLDGHDRGVKVVARILRDAGYEVIYTGLFQSPETVAAAAVDEDVDVVGLSLLWGIVPAHDMDELKRAGVAGVLTPGATADEVVAAIEAAIGTPA